MLSSDLKLIFDILVSIITLAISCMALFSSINNRKEKFRCFIFVEKQDDGSHNSWLQLHNFSPIKTIILEGINVFYYDDNYGWNIVGQSIARYSIGFVDRLSKKESHDYGLDGEAIFHAIKNTKSRYFKIEIQTIDKKHTIYVRIKRNVSIDYLLLPAHKHIRRKRRTSKLIKDITDFIYLDKQ